MKTSVVNRSRGRVALTPGATGHKQRGVILMVVLAVLGLLMLAAVGVLRAVDTSNVIAGNFSFQQAAIQASDRAVTNALDNLATIVAGGGGNTAVANRYFAVRQTSVDSRGFPTVTWANVSCADDVGASIGTTECATDSGKYRVQYVIERLCNANPSSFADAASLRAECEYEADSTYTAAEAIALRYRILVRVRGPRGTEGWFETVVAGPASS
jgi:type IV pilus assembly protein PilX